MLKSVFGFKETIFDSYSKGSTTVNQSYEGSNRFTSTSVDPMIMMYNIGSFDPNIYKYIAYKYRVLSGTAGNLELFFTNSQYSVATGGISKSTSLNSDGEWHTAFLDMSTHAKWTDSNITGWRFDWATTSGVTMEIAYVGITSGTSFGVEDTYTRAVNASECSVTNGLVAWYPLQGDAKELVDRKDGVVTGAVPDGRGYLFDGSNDRVTSSVPLLGNGNPHSFCFWFKLNSAISSRVDPFTMGNAATNQYSSIDVNSTSINWYFYSNDTTASFTPAVGQWYFLAASYAGGAANNTNKKLYINAQPLSLSAGSSTVSALPDNPNLGIGYDRGRSTAYFPGNIADVRIYNRALSAEEIDILYNTTNPESETKMKLTEDCVYLQGQLKEV
jgi:hypothetical protein